MVIPFCLEYTLFYPFLTRLSIVLRPIWLEFLFRDLLL
ncbi:hypothetical protein LINGRAHAP2_LOCUS2335 [Linum grandiflorum]